MWPCLCTPCRCNYSHNKKQPDLRFSFLWFKQVLDLVQNKESNLIVLCPLIIIILISYIIIYYYLIINYGEPSEPKPETAETVENWPKQPQGSLLLARVPGKCNKPISWFTIHFKRTCPAWLSAPGLVPNPPSKFLQATTNSTAASTSTASSRPSNDKQATAQNENLQW